MINHEQVDEFIEKAIPILEAALQQQSIDSAHIESWPHGSPALEAWWESLTDPGLHRNVLLFVTNADSLSFRVRLEGNAWRDCEGVRKWHYHNFGSFGVAELYDERNWAAKLATKLNRLVAEVSTWGPTTLDRREELALHS